MGSDRARITYDEKRKYKRVVAQQGRAIIEADLNEAQEILTEDARKEALDVIGAAGTPDNGYAVSSPSAGQIKVGKGTMYLGGNRLTLESDVLLSNQPEWLDNTGAAPSPLPDAEIVALLVTEQEVSAEEDRALREVALGGPDTAQRTRLVQSFMRAPLDAQHKKSCEAAMDSMGSTPLAVGRDYDGSTGSVYPTCKLKAHFTTTQGGLCEPISKAGYLGADNVLVRVQVSAPDKIVWALDNGSLLYRLGSIAVDTNASPHQLTVTLASRPVDVFHAPRIGQTVELLRARVSLGQGEYIAAPTGVMTKVIGYDDEALALTLEGDVDAGYEADGDGGRLFARLWEDELEVTLNHAITLGTTGLDVTLMGSELATGAYWIMALRPGAPDQVFPKAFLGAAGVSPNGPRQWLCPLGIIDWGANGVGTLLHDCRKKFDNLVELTARPYGFFSIGVSPIEVSGSKLQDLLDNIKLDVPPLQKVTIGFQPGIYELTAPLVLGPEHAGLILEGSGGAAVITVAPGSEQAFLHGLVVLDGATDVSITGFTFAMSPVGLMSAHGRLAGVPADDLYLSSNGAIDLRGLESAVGMRVIGGSARVRDCTFDFSNIAPPSTGQTIFAAGILTNGQVDSLVVERCELTGPSRGSTTWGAALQSFGVVVAPTTFITSSVGSIQAGRVSASVAELTIHECRFDGLTAASLVHGSAPRISVCSNVINRCHSGFWLVPTSVLGTGALAMRNAAASLPSLVDGPGASGVESALGGLLADPLLTSGGALARALPLDSAHYPLSTTQALTSLDQTSLQGMLVAVESALSASTTTAAIASLPRSIRIEGNQFMGPATSSAYATSGSRAAFLVWDDGWVTNGMLETSVTLGSNWIVGLSDFAMVALVGTRWCAAGGNTIRNLSAAMTGSPHSLVIIPPLGGATAESAIAGNTFTAPSLLPKRATAGGLPTVPWSFFNMEDGAGNANGGSTGGGGGGTTGLAAPITFDSTFQSPLITQPQRAGTGTNAGVQLRIQGQQGQQSVGTSVNNDGGSVSIEGGAPGTGGAAGTGNQGAARLASNVYHVEASSQGITFELGQADRTTHLTGPVRLTSAGADVLQMRAYDEGTSLTPGLLSPTALMLGAGYGSVSIRIDPTLGIRFKGRDALVEGIPFRHQKNTVSSTNGVVQIDLSKGNLHDIALTENTHFTLLGVSADMRFELRVRQTYPPGGYTVTWDSNFVFAASTDGDPSAQGITIYDFSVDSLNKARCVHTKKGL